MSHVRSLRNVRHKSVFFSYAHESPSTTCRANDRYPFETNYVYRCWFSHMNQTGPGRLVSADFADQPVGKIARYGHAR